jgi:hypothetical protein
MLIVTITGDEFFNEETEEFVTIGDVVLELEHSLLSVSKWESKFQKPFLASGEKSREEVLEYLRMMILNKDIPEDIHLRLDQTNMDLINEYVGSAQSATTFGQIPDPVSKAEVITSELVYYWMVAFNIPFECETWHLNRLFSLIRICNIKNSKPSKMSKASLAQRNRDLNAQRRSQLGSLG